MTRMPPLETARLLIRPFVMADLEALHQIVDIELSDADFGTAGETRDKVQLLIHADIGTDYPASKVVSVGYVITDRNGRMAGNNSADMRLLPVMNGVPSALQYTAGASLAPGDYTLKLAVVEGERVGSVEHTVHATLPDAAGLTLSELMVGGPVDVGELLTPTIGYQITFGSVHGYVEAYGTQTDGVTMEYEVATGPDEPALLNVDVPARPVGDSRVIFSRVLPIHQVPPGKYVLRAILSAGGTSVKTLTRGFEIAPRFARYAAQIRTAASTAARLRARRRAGCLSRQRLSCRGSQSAPSFGTRADSPI